MSLLQAQAITKQFGAKLVLNEVSLALNEGERMALVGFDITLIDLLQQLVPHRRRWGMCLIETQTFQLSGQ